MDDSPYAATSALTDLMSCVAKAKNPRALAPPSAERAGDVRLEDLPDLVEKMGADGLSMLRENGVTALTTEKCRAITIHRADGTSFEVAKATIAAATSDAIDPNLSFAPAAEVEARVQQVIKAAHHSSRQLRDQRGKWRGTLFRAADVRPFGGVFFR